MVRPTFDDQRGRAAPTILSGDATHDDQWMTFTLIEGDADDQTLESEVRAVFGSARSREAPGAAPTLTFGAGTQNSASTLRRILGSDPQADEGPPTPEVDVSATAMTPQVNESTPASSTGDDSGALLRPHPSVDRLDNEFTVLAPPVTSHHPAARRFLRRRG